MKFIASIILIIVLQQIYCSPELFDFQQSLKKQIISGFTFDKGYYEYINKTSEKAMTATFESFNKENTDYLANKHNMTESEMKKIKETFDNPSDKIYNISHPIKEEWSDDKIEYTGNYYFYSNPSGKSVLLLAYEYSFDFYFQKNKIPSVYSYTEKDKEIIEKGKNNMFAVLMYSLLSSRPFSNF